MHRRLVAGRHAFGQRDAVLVFEAVGEHARQHVLDGLGRLPRHAQVERLVDAAVDVGQLDARTGRWWRSAPRRRSHVKVRRHPSGVGCRPGTGASMVSSAPVTGCRVVSRHACRACLGKSRRTEASAGSVDVPPPRLAIGGVADQRPPARGQVHADLMRPARHEPAAQQRQAGCRRRHAREALESREARRAHILGGHDAAAIAGVAPQAQIDVATRDVHLAVDDRQVVLGRRARRQRSSAATCGWRRSWPRARCPRSACRAVPPARDAGATATRARATAARSSACPTGSCAPDAPPGRPACRSPAGARPRTAPGARCPRPPSARVGASGSATDTTSPRAARTATRWTALPLTVTRPPSIQACTRVRVAARTSVRCRRSTRSSRCPASPRSAVTMRHAASVIEVYRIAGPYNHETR